MRFEPKSARLCILSDDWNVGLRVSGDSAHRRVIPKSNFPIHSVTVHDVLLAIGLNHITHLLLQSPHLSVISASHAHHPSLTQSFPPDFNSPLPYNNCHPLKTDVTLWTPCTEYLGPFSGFYLFVGFIFCRYAGRVPIAKIAMHRCGVSSVWPVYAVHPIGSILKVLFIIFFFRRLQKMCVTEVFVCCLFSRPAFGTSMLCSWPATKCQSVSQSVNQKLQYQSNRT